jgi:hypothetical protein
MPNSATRGPLEFYKSRFEIENDLTRNILNAIPPDRLDYRPHDRSPSTGKFLRQSCEGCMCVSKVRRHPTKAPRWGEPSTQDHWWMFASQISPGCGFIVKTFVTGRVAA